MINLTIQQAIKNNYKFIIYQNQLLVVTAFEKQVLFKSDYKFLYTVKINLDGRLGIRSITSDDPNLLMTYDEVIEKYPDYLL